MVMMTNHIERGQHVNGSPWICGEVSLGKKTVYVDTRTGKGINDILFALRKFISYQSYKIKFPTMHPEDVAQELNLLAIEAIPKYEDDKNTNMLTFLQGHIKNRLINKCKYVSEKKRRATHLDLPECKLRCPTCKKYMFTDAETVSICSRCGAATDNGLKWKRYNIPVLPILFSSLEKKMQSSGGGSSSEDSSSLEDLLPTNQTFATLAGRNHYGIDEEVQFRLDFRKVYETLDDTNKKIVSMLLEGYAYRDIATKIGISEKATYARVAKILHTSKTE